MQNDYKVLPEDITNRKTSKYQRTMDATPPIQEIEVQSAICSPRSGDTVYSSDGSIELRGYAVDGEGGPVRGVYVSLDEGKSYRSTEITYQQGKYSWTLWRYRVSNITPETKIWSRAQGARCNMQPISATWNVRGVMYNAVGEVTNITVLQRPEH
jgi:sulfite oxidase